MRPLGGRLASPDLRAALALLLLVAGCSTGEFRIENETALEGYLVRSPERPVLIVDIDDTIVRRGGGSSIRLWAHVGYRGDRPLEGAPQALRLLAGRWNLIFLTARDDSLRNPTLDWLGSHGFPQAPVVFSDSYLYGEKSRADFKQGAIRRLLEKGFKPGWGIGDKASDMVAYRENGLRTILILDGPFDPDQGRTLAALGVSSIGLGTGKAPPEVMIFEQSQAWEAIQKLLEPAGPGGPPAQGSGSPAAGKTAGP